ncbi:MAG: diadenylate cyclase CdaA [Caldilineales bacterium]|nr:diadenylate cyclase CdaA [Caldilineales bacterium]
MEDFLAVFSQFQFPQDVIDVLLVALVFFGILRLISGTRGVPLLRGLLVIAFVGVLAGTLTSLTAFSWLIRYGAIALLIAIPVIFQPELRRLLERLGRTGNLFSRSNRTTGASRTISELVAACTRLSRLQYGALIVLEDEVNLQDFIEGGIRMNSNISADLLVTIFYPGTPLHDGAVILRGSIIESAACVLPLTQRTLTDTSLGTRHRAGIGVTEDSDALSLIVSEETGTISAARNGRLARRLDEKRLRRVLERFYERSGRMLEIEDEDV